MVFDFHSLSVSDMADCVRNKSNFQIKNVSASTMGNAVSMVEQAIERQGLRCRIYTKGRVAVAGAELVVGGAGVLGLAGIAAHNLATFNPDYEVAKDFINSKIIVTYQK